MLSSSAAMLRAVLLIAAAVFFTAVVGQQTFTSSPFRSWSFTTAPTSSQLTGGTAFGWYPRLAGFGQGQHYGLAFFNGVGGATGEGVDLINLQSFPDDNGQTFPTSWGGAPFTIEMWVNTIELNSNARLFESGNLAGSTLFDTVALYNAGQGNNLVFSTTVNTPVTANLTSTLDPWHVFFTNTWQQIVITVAQPNITDFLSATSSLQTAYSNGAQIPNYSGAGPNPLYAPLPEATTRSYAIIGTSKSGGTWYYQGYIDSFYYYNYALSAKQVALHYITPRPPVFDLAFGQDPRPLANAQASAAAYSWSLQPSTSDPYHTGVLQLSSGQFISLSSATGTTSVGTTLPTVGGAGSGNTSSNLNPALIAGWTFECSIQIQTATADAAIFDLANTGDVDEIELEFGSSSNVLQFFISSSVSGTSVTVPITSSATTGVWYYIALTVNNNTATSWLNGVAQASVPMNGVTIGAFPRPLSFIGQSNSHTTTFAAFWMESFRIYDYILSNGTIRNVFATYSAPQTPPPTAVIQSAYPYTSSPTNVWTFDTPLNEFETDSNFTWVAGAADYVPGQIVHYGLAEFDGIFNGLSYLDLDRYADVYGNYLPQSFGGSMSWEAWVNWENVMQWARIFDSGGVEGPGDNNVYLAAYPGTNGFYWIANVDYGSPQDTITGTTTINPQSANLLINNRQWYHIVLTIGQSNRGVQNGSSSATMILYVNGVQQASTGTGNSPPTGGSWLPQNVTRTNSYAARSNWPADARFQGWFDMLAYYPYALDSEAVLAHSVVTIPPIFELTFATNPTTGLIGQSIGVPFNGGMYGWQQISNTSGYNNTQVSGILTLIGNNQFVNLSASTGVRSVGTVLPIIGTLGSGTNSTVEQGSVGISIEFSFNCKIASTNDNYAKIMDWGNGPNTDNIVIGWNGNSGNMAIQIMTPQNPGPSPDNFLNNVQLNTWYHVVIVINPIDPLVAYTATYTFYVNGVYTGGVGSISSPRNWPRAIQRNNALLGGSSWGDPSFIGEINAVRVYDYALTADTATLLYNTVMQRPSQIPIPVYTSGPTTAYTFDDPPTQADRISAGTLYSWTANAPGDMGTANQFLHYGTVKMNGTLTSQNFNGYVDMYNVYDSNFQLFPTVIGGSISFEMWIQYDAITSQGQIFDIGNGAGVNNLLMGQVFSTNNLFVDFYPSSPLASYHQVVNGAVQLGQWQHIVYTNQQNNPQSQNSVSASTATIYINGQNVSSLPTSYVEAILRTSAKLGLSAWGSDGQFNGYIDSFYYYNYALSAEAVPFHYVLPRPPIFEATFSQDPRAAGSQFNIPGLSPTTATYGWEQQDPADVATGLNVYHQGLITLNAASAQYVDLCAGRGPTSIGTIMPDIGGTGYIQQPQVNRPYIRGGWSFELSFKPLVSGENFAKIIDWGNGPYTDNIVIGYTGTTRTLAFQIFDSRDTTGESGVDITLINSIVPGQWYHIVVTVNPINNQQLTSQLIGYVNGIPVTGNLSYTQPLQTYRQNCYMGKSSWGDAPMAALIDRVAVYDYVLRQGTVAALYALEAPPRPCGIGGYDFSSMINGPDLYYPNQTVTGYGVFVHLCGAVQNNVCRQQSGYNLMVCQYAPSSQATNDLGDLSEEDPIVWSFNNGVDGSQGIRWNISDGAVGTCSNGLNRNTTGLITCGATTQITSFNEAVQCNYVITMTSPLACSPAVSSSAPPAVSSSAAATPTSAATTTSTVTPTSTQTSTQTSGPTSAPTTAATSAPTSTPTAPSQGPSSSSSSVAAGQTFGIGCNLVAAAGAVTGSVTVNSDLPTLIDNVPAGQTLQSVSTVITAALAAGLGISQSNIVCTGASDTNGNTGDSADAGTTTFKFAINNVATATAQSAITAFNTASFNSALRFTTTVAATGAVSCTSNCGGSSGGGSGLSGGAIAGIVIGVIVGICLLALIIAFCFCGLLRRQKAVNKQADGVSHDVSMGTQGHTQLEDQHNQQEESVQTTEEDTHRADEVETNEQQQGEDIEMATV